ncbi:MAG: galactoside O-acetyltransferase [Bacilli bacterium]|nr:galactoside O-acetyltransferase [Bacilli bacterium]
MEENTNIDMGGVIMNTRAKVIFKKNSGAAFGFTAVTGNHMSIVGLNLKQIDDKVKDKMDINKEMDKDIVVEEDVWIGNHVILLSGVRLGRGCEVGAGSVVRNNIPPYAVVIGNPCKVIGFRFTPEEIIEHEKQQYDESERLPYDLLSKNYEKYFLNRIKEIKQITKI